MSARAASISGSVKFIPNFDIRDRGSIFLKTGESTPHVGARGLLVAQTDYIFRNAIQFLVLGRCGSHLVTQFPRAGHMR